MWVTICYDHMEGKKTVSFTPKTIDMSASAGLHNLIIKVTEVANQRESQEFWSV